MATREQIEKLEATKLELSAKIQEADGKALKCYKMGLIFKDEYPEEFSRYSEARLQYNQTEDALSELYMKLEKELEEHRDGETI